MISTLDKIKKRKEANDVFITPETVVKVHMDILKPFMEEYDKILDPFYGTGRYYDALILTAPNNCEFDFTEINMGKDFFDYDKPVDIIASNPPYSILEKVLEKCISLNPRVISFIIGINNLTAKRLEYMNKNGYYLQNLHMTKVFQWFGMSLILTFIKGGKNCIDFDRKVHK